mmetsp:Transcript_26820/g.56492  ORF Transcript_26820/g.56492 Transcript_26820/m.56492 type:complete len:83 (+) Transcript_26820:3874-4122(+)
MAFVNSTTKTTQTLWEMSVSQLLAEISYLSLTRFSLCSREKVALIIKSEKTTTICLSNFNQPIFMRNRRRTSMRTYPAEETS